MLRLLFENIDTGEHRTIDCELYHDRCLFIGEHYFVGVDGKPIADCSDTKAEAIKNGIVSWVPKYIWGWHDVAYLGYIEPDQN